VASYGDLATIIHRYSDDAVTDSYQLYKQMIINVLVSNRDDHLRNVEMHWINGGWRLTPAYDLLPSEDGEIYHATRFGLNEYVENWKTILSLAKKFKLSENQAEIVRDEIMKGVEMLDGIVKSSNINERDATWFKGVIAKQASLLLS
jgi:serine/threonine-protein kinase HipA